MLVDPKVVGHYPYLARYIGPAPFPAWSVYFLDPRIPLHIYREKALAASDRTRPIKLVLDHQRAVSYMMDRPPVPCGPPTGRLSVRPSAWDWAWGIDARGPAKKLVPIKKPADTMLERGSLRHPFLAVEMNDREGSLYIAEVHLDGSLPELRSKAQAFVRHHWLRCYLVFEDQRALYYDLDGRQHVQVLPPERKWFSCVPVFDWSEVPL